MVPSSLLAEADDWLQLYRLGRVEGGPSAVSLIERLLAALSVAEADSEHLAEMCICRHPDSLVREWVSKAREVARHKCVCEIDKHDFNCPVHNDSGPSRRGPNGDE